ncbi:MAG: hypothetical protein HYU78_10470 [Rhodocyclales bacterium]|nr:hypothetical protein [Rhodocyclales bacterium]
MASPVSVRVLWKCGFRLFSVESRWNFPLPNCKKGFPDFGIASIIRETVAADEVVPMRHAPRHRLVFPKKPVARRGGGGLQSRARFAKRKIVIINHWRLLYQTGAASFQGKRV